MMLINLTIVLGGHKRDRERVRECARLEGGIFGLRITMNPCESPRQMGTPQKDG